MKRLLLLFTAVLAVAACEDQQSLMAPTPNLSENALVPALAGPAPGTNDDGTCVNVALNDVLLNPAPGEQGWRFQLFQGFAGGSILNATFSTTGGDVSVSVPGTPTFGPPATFGPYYYLVYTPIDAALKTVSVTNAAPNAPLVVLDCEKNAIAPAGGTLQACKYDDSNANGTQDAAEPARAGWALTIDDGAGGKGGAPEEQTQTTDESGCVSWTNLAAGSYSVAEAAPAGGPPWINTDPGTDDGPCLMTVDDCLAPQKSADVTEGETTVIWFGNIQSAEIEGLKFYDANTNGANDDGQFVEGWKFTLTGTDLLGNTLDPTEVVTDGSGVFGFVGLLPGNYTVTEADANGHNWLHSTFTTLDFGLLAGQQAPAEFGNYCLVAPGGRGVGFWSNKQGDRLIDRDDLRALSDLHLVDDDGHPFDPRKEDHFQKWLRGGRAKNMAYKLSVQLAATALDVWHRLTDPHVVVDGSRTVAELLMYADGLLAADGNTRAGDPNRAEQERVKDLLEAITDGQRFLQPTAATCPTPEFGATSGGDDHDGHKDRDRHDRDDKHDRGDRHDGHGKSWGKDDHHKNPWSYRRGHH